MKLCNFFQQVLVFIDLSGSIASRNVAKDFMDERLSSYEDAQADYVANIS